MLLCNGRRPQAFLSSLGIVALMLNPGGREASAQSVADTPAQVTKLSAQTRLVALDVVVTDSQGRPVTGLTQEDFKVQEDNVQQTVRFFDIHTSAPPANANASAAPKLPAMPPNTFLNLQKGPEYGTPTVILYDALNTPLTDQFNGRKQLLDFIKHRKPGTQIAVFILTGKLHLLQGFTDDTDLLGAALASKAGRAQTTTMIGPGVGSTTATSGNPEMTTTTGAAPGAQGSTVSGGDPDQGFTDFMDKAREFDELDKQQLQDERVELTIRALTDLGRFLAPLSGRKDLIWFSSAFPVGILPDPAMTIKTPDQQRSEVHDRDMRDYAGKIKQAADLLNLSHVSVYPVDLRGVRVNAELSAASNASFGANPSFGGAAASLQQTRNTTRATTSTSMNLSQQTFVLEDESRRMTMDSIADATGGHAFYGTNGLEEAMKTALLSGSTYYSLSYEPTNPKYDGSLRHMKVSLKKSGYTLAYRKVYYADDLKAVAHATADAPESPLTPALERGTPLEHGLFLQVHLEVDGTPVPATPQQMRVLAQYETMRSEKKSSGKTAPVMMQQYLVSYGLIARQLEMPADDTGNRQASLEFGVIAYDEDGRKLNGLDTRVDETVPEARYAKLVSDGYHAAQPVAVPVTTASLRLAVRDNKGNRVGSLEVELPLAKAADARVPVK